ncbi:nucleotide pyrophosphohydrolase [Candidatus Woesearchaeota archaeon]|nr:nucleotide pyrophosphohydrolase [Candidatus Woesearchaeota archaeon]
MHDATTAINELKQLAEKFREERDWKQFHTPKDMAIDVAVEAGEILEHFRFRTNEEIMQFLKDPQKKQQISHEMSDVLWGLLYLAIDMDIDLAAAFDEKLKLSAKKYPIEKAKGVNKKYTEL